MQFSIDLLLNPFKIWNSFIASNPVLSNVWAFENGIRQKKKENWIQFCSKTKIENLLHLKLSSNGVKCIYLISRLYLQQIITSIIIIELAFIGPHSHCPVSRSLIVGLQIQFVRHSDQPLARKMQFNSNVFFRALKIKFTNWWPTPLKWLSHSTKPIPGLHF